MINIAIVENETILLETLCQTFKNDPNVQCLGAFQSAETALAQLPTIQPDVVLMDIDLGPYRMTGIECIVRVKDQCPNTKFLVFTIFEDHQHVFDALAAGALGYILKSSSPDKIIAAIIDIMEGGSPITPSIARKLVQQLSNPQQPQQLSLLTKRENEIIALIAKGYTEQEVANTLYISYKTVKTHITNIYQKLQVNTRVDALNKYFGR